jgi:exosortase
MGRFNRALKQMEVLGFIKISMKAEDTIVDSTATVSPGRKNSLMGCLPLAVFVGWWIYSLQFQWRAQEEYRFGYLVVVLVAFLVWDRWDGRPRGDTPVTTWRASGWLLVGFPLVLVAELYRHALARSPASATALSLGTLCFIRASILQQWGPQTLRHFRFPILFALIAVPVPGIFWNPIVLGLKGLVTFVNVELLNLLGIPAQQQGSVIQLPNCRVGVDEACSGIRSLQSSLMMALFIGDQSLRRAGLRGLLVGGAVGWAVVGNIGRSLYLSLTAHRHGTEALDAVHDTAGWSVLAVTLVGLGAMAWALARSESAWLQLAKRRRKISVNP